MASGPLDKFPGPFASSFTCALIFASVSGVAWPEEFLNQAAAVFQFVGVAFENFSVVPSGVEVSPRVEATAAGTLAEAAQPTSHE